jgi:hypothetical protein
LIANGVPNGTRGEWCFGPFQNPQHANKSSKFGVGVIEGAIPMHIYRPRDPARTKSRVTTGREKSNGTQQMILVGEVASTGMAAALPPDPLWDHGSGLGRWRWLVERTLAWLNQFRRLRVRYDKRTDVHEAFLSLGCAMICWQWLRKTWRTIWADAHFRRRPSPNRHFRGVIAYTPLLSGLPGPDPGNRSTLGRQEGTISSALLSGAGRAPLGPITLLQVKE